MTVDRPALLATTTGEPLQPVRLYYTLPNAGRDRVLRQLSKLRCIDRAPHAPLWGWWHRREAASLDFTRFAANAAALDKPVVLATIAFPSRGEMVMSLRSFHRALLAARFFGERLGERAILSRLRVLNRFLAAPGPAGGLEAIDAMLDEDVVVKDPAVAEARWATMLSQHTGPGPITPDEFERLCAAEIERHMPDDLPEVEDFPLCPEEETPSFTSLKTTLDLRFMRALHHWQGRTDVSLTKIIVDLVAATTRAA